MFLFYFLKKNPWLFHGYPAVSLTHEMNYAVWWSGIGLFVAGLVFFRVAQIDVEKRLAFGILGLACVALCIDEIGSLHESVARIGGWVALAPFAMVFGAMFSWSLFILYRDTRTLWTALLVTLGVGVFVGVAGLEFIEHNIIIWDATLRRLRLIGEEAIELVGISFLVIGGLLAYRRLRHRDPAAADAGIISVSAVLDLAMRYPVLSFALFFMQTTMAIGVVLPHSNYLTEGNVLSLYPLLMAFSLGLYCFYRARSYSGRAQLQWLGLVLVLTSVLQIFELYELVGKFLLATTGYNGAALQPPAFWFALLVPWTMSARMAVAAGVMQWRDVIVDLVLIGIVLIAIIPDLVNPDRREFLFFLFAGFIMFSCYRFIFAVTRRDELQGSGSMQAGY